MIRSYDKVHEVSATASSISESTGSQFCIISGKSQLFYRSYCHIAIEKHSFYLKSQCQLITAYILGNQKLIINVFFLFSASDVTASETTIFFSHFKICILKKIDYCRFLKKYIQNIYLYNFAYLLQPFMFQGYVMGLITDSINLTGIRDEWS